MRPDAAARIIRPVGVGRMSRGPIGVDGFTMTAGSALRAIIASTRRSAITLLALYVPIAASAASGCVSSAGWPSARSASVATLLV